MTHHPRASGRVAEASRSREAPAGREERPAPGRILYIAGWGRSGTTLLGNILNEYPGFTHVGEVIGIWRHGVMANGLCGCGRPFRACDFWREVFGAAFGSFEAVDGERLNALRFARVQNRHLLARRLAKREPQPSPVYLDALDRLYRAMFRVARPRVLVDSSKFPSHAYLLERLGYELHVLHLVRDPRAVATSWKKSFRYDLGGGRSEAMQRFTPLQSTVKWGLWNQLLEGSGRRYMRVRFEDFLADPQAVTDAIVAFAGGADPRSTPFVSSRRVQLGENHTAFGNPNRTAAGPIEITPAGPWKLSWRERASVSLLALPWSARYGYPRF